MNISTLPSDVRENYCESSTIVLVRADAGRLCGSNRELNSISRARWMSALTRQRSIVGSVKFAVHETPYAHLLPLLS